MKAISLVDGSKLLERIDAWKEKDRSGPGGRLETFPIRALLVAMVVCALTNEAMLATNFTDVLFRRISPAMRHALGIETLPGSRHGHFWDNCYRNVRTRFHGLTDLMDPSPYPKNRRMDPVTFDALVELRRLRRSDEERSEREERLLWFINEILEISIRMVPREIRRKWKGSASVDATVIPAFARPARTLKRKRKGQPLVTVRHSSDPDAGLYHRDKRETLDGDTEAKMTIHGYEATLVVSGSDHPNQPSAMPTLVIGMAVLHRPGFEVGQNTTRALSSVVGRGHPANHLAGDRAYSNSKPEHFQLPARALGYDLVLDYRIDQLGLQATFAGMIQVDGNWYCPGMPETLINATLDFRNKVIDETTYRARIKERRAYRIRAKSGPDPDGHVRMRCPASKPAPVVRCELKLGSEGPATTAKVRIPVTPPSACTPH